MKIELNPNRMTIAELNDCIAELTAQRDRLQEIDRQNVCEQCHDAVIDMMGKLWEFTDRNENPWEVTLFIRTSNNRTHRIKMDMDSIEEWHVEVAKPAQ